MSEVLDISQFVLRKTPSFGRMIILLRTIKHSITYCNLKRYELDSKPKILSYIFILFKNFFHQIINLLCECFHLRTILQIIHKNLSM